MRAAFTRIYDFHGWGYGSGSGSSPDATASYRDFLQAKLDEWRPLTVVDVGCGDWQFSRLIDWGSASYLGIDVVDRLVEENRRLFARPNIEFEVRDVFADPPGGDLLLCKDVLQHWPLQTVHSFLNLLPRFRRALITNCVRPNPNGDILPGGYRPLDFRKPPFNGRLSVVHEYVTPDAEAHQKAIFLWDAAQE